MFRKPVLIKSKILTSFPRLLLINTRENIIIRRDSYKLHDDYRRLTQNTKGDRVIHTLAKRWIGCLACIFHVVILMWQLDGQRWLRYIASVWWILYPGISLCQLSPPGKPCDDSSWIAVGRHTVQLDCLTGLGWTVTTTYCNSIWGDWNT